jgi:hypothetical protein
LIIRTRRRNRSRRRSIKGVYHKIQFNHKPGGGWARRQFLFEETSNVEDSFDLKSADYNTIVKRSARQSFKRTPKELFFFQGFFYAFHSDSGGKFFMKYFFVCLWIFIFLVFFSGCSHSNNLQIIKSANEAHYNLTTAGLKSFSCKIKVKELNEMAQHLRDVKPGDQTKSAVKSYLIDYLNNVQILATLKNDGDLNLELSSNVDTGIEALDQRFESLTDGAKGIARSFLGIWGELTFQTIFSDIGPNFNVADKQNSYFVAYGQDNIDVNARLTKEGRLTEFTTRTREGNINFKTNFLNTDKGFLLKDYKVSLSDESIEISAQIDYRQIDGFYLPQTVNILNSYKTGPVGLTLSFSDYKLEKY